jgi:hypothetical protein
MLRRGVLILVVSILLCAGCRRSPTSTSPITSAPNDHETYAWAPCVVVQSPGGPPFNIQMQAVQKLQRAGKMSWIRLNAHLDGRGIEYYLEARRLGLNIFAIVHMSDLESAGWEAAFDRLHGIYPGDIWEIAGEISNPDPNVNPVTVTPDYYMSKFKNLYSYVKAKYPAAVLTNAPPFGSGSTGPPELEEFFQLGLLDLDVVVAINVYSNHALSRYATVIDKYADRLAGKRIWVTETGSSNPDNHIAWVQEFYPRIVNTVHPEMICWYAMWGGDSAQGDNGFGLLDKVQAGPSIERSLFKALTGEQ